MNRKHEIWDIDGHADMLAGVWGKPTAQRGRHWESLVAIRDLTRTSNILDIACGQGHFFGVLPTPKPDYLGIDNSEDMLAKAKEAFPAYNTYFVQGDAYDLGDIASRDTVVIIDLLMHLPEIETPVLQAWSKTQKELIIAHQIALKNVMTSKTFSGKITLPEDKRLLNRYDTLDTMFAIFAKLDDLASIEQFFYDRRLQIFRLSRGIPQYGSWRKGWQLDER